MKPILLLTCFFSFSISYASDNLQFLTHSFTDINPISDGELPTKLFVSSTAKTFVMLTTHDRAYGARDSGNAKYDIWYSRYNVSQRSGGLSGDGKVFVGQYNGFEDAPNRNEYFFEPIHQFGQTLPGVIEYFGALPNTNLGFFHKRVPNEWYGTYVLALQNLATGRDLMRIPINDKEYTDIQVSESGKTWLHARMIDYTPAGEIEVFETGKTRPIFKMPARYLGYEFSSSGYELALQQGENWNIYDLKSENNRRCKLEIPENYRVADLKFASGVAIGLLMKGTSQLCSHSEANCQIVKWSMETCKIAASTPGRLRGLGKIAWLDKERLLVIDNGDRFERRRYNDKRDNVVLVDFGRSLTKTASSIDGFRILEADIALKKEELFLATNESWSSPAPHSVRVYKVPFTSIH